MSTQFPDIWHAGAANEIGWYVESASTPGIPNQSATIAAVVSRAGTQVASVNTSTFLPTLAFPDGRVGGYQLALTGAQISTPGLYQVVLTVTIGGVVVETATFNVNAITYDGQ